MVDLIWFDCLIFLLSKGPEHLPRLAEGGKAPRNLVSDYGNIIEPADGFAQVLYTFYPSSLYPSFSIFLDSF